MENHLREVLQSCDHGSFHKVKIQVNGKLMVNQQLDSKCKLCSRHFMHRGSYSVL
jgi:hypothetical protein